MRLLPQLFYSTVLATFTMLAYSADGFAHEERLGCRGAAEDSSFERDVPDGATITVTSKGFKVQGYDKLLTKSLDEVATMDTDEALKIPRAERRLYSHLSVKITAECYGDKPKELWPAETSLSCKSNTKLIVKLHDPTCSEKLPGLQAVFDVTEEADKDDLVAQDEQRRHEEFDRLFSDESMAELDKKIAKCGFNVSCPSTFPCFFHFILF